MTEILLLHSALGRRRGVLCFAEILREAGHRIHVLDLFDGETFDDLEKGIAKRSALGIPELIRRAEAEAAGLDPGFVAAGFSMGAAVAKYIAGTTPRSTCRCSRQRRRSPG
jgi:hypothetical protein